jgi:hypothetical protein
LHWFCLKILAMAESEGMRGPNKDIEAGECRDSPMQIGAVRGTQGHAQAAT